jgi:colicin import membrane protein
MTTLEITTVNPSEYGIAENKASELVGNLPLIKAERDLLSQQYNNVVLLDIEDAATSKIARELRLKIRDNRTKGIDVWHKTTKDFFLKGGQFVDAIKRQEVAVNERMEKNLENIEKYFENLEKERRAQLNAERISELEPFNAFVPMGLNFGELSEDEYTKVLNGTKLQFEHQQEEERKAEAEIQRLAEVQNLHSVRKDTLWPVWQFIENKDVNFGEMTESEFSTIKENAVSKKVEFDAEQIKIKAENERLEAEKKTLEAKAAKEKAEADKKLAKERAEQAAKLKAEQEAKAKIEAELQAKKDKEAKAEKERLAEEKRMKEEAEALAKAPIKDQLNAWVTSFELPSANIENEKADLIKAKFEAFKRWAFAEIDLM